MTEIRLQTGFKPFGSVDLEIRSYSICSDTICILQLRVKANYLSIIVTKNGFKTITLFDGSFQPADLSSSSSTPTGSNRRPTTIRELKRYIWWPANKILSVFQLAVIVFFLICLVCH